MPRFCRKNIWNQGKALTPEQLWRAGILPKEHLESRQSWAVEDMQKAGILPKEHLESRQSQTGAFYDALAILPKEHLESRQSRARVEGPERPDFAERTFGIKALAPFPRRDFAERTFGIKAKQLTCRVLTLLHFAERTFGIKAKPDDR